MGKFEPDDSRDITQKPSDVPIEPERTGPREKETRNPANQTTEGGTPQRSEYEPKGKDLPRRSESDTRALRRN